MIIKKAKDGFFEVQSRSKPKIYLVNVEKETCTCLWFDSHGWCEHLTEVFTRLSESEAIGIDYSS